MRFLSNRPTYEKVIWALGLLVLLVYLVLYLPPTRERRELVQDLETIVQRLERKDYGVDEETVLKNLRRVDAELRLLRSLDREDNRTLETDPMVAGRIAAPFQYFEFDREKNAMISRIRRRAAQQGVEVRDEVVDALPDYVGQEREYLLWAQLALANQVLLGAVENGLDRISHLRFPQVRRVVAEDREVFEEVALRIRVGGRMDALNPFLLYLILDAEQVEEAGLPNAYSGKRALFIDRFVLRKEAIERPDDVIAELEIKSILKRD